MLRFKNPAGSNNAVASGPGSLGYRYEPRERFCMLGWHWVPEFYESTVWVEIYEQKYRRLGIYACQRCMNSWYDTGRAHIGTLTGNIVLWPGDFRVSHLCRIKRWRFNGAPLSRIRPE